MSSDSASAQHNAALSHELARRVLTACGAGRVAIVGGEDGPARELTRELLNAGADARAIEARSLAPSCCDTLVCLGALDGLTEGALRTAAASMLRAAGRAVYAVVSVKDRSRRLWEHAFYEAGGRRHPRSMRALGYNAIGHEGSTATLVLESVPAEAFAEWPLESLAAERDHHMDMCREAGRRADAHVARYDWASDFVRPGDTVLDCASGLGYGSRILACCSQASRVIGIDADADAVRYAAAHYASADGSCPLEFRVGDACDLSSIPDGSVGVVVSMETLEHLRDPHKALTEFFRVLSPAGRVVVSVPNDWRDESGTDPNPHHHQVYTWDDLRKQLAERFMVERVFRQNCGGDHEGETRSRELVEVEPSRAAGTPKSQAEWWLATAMKSPLAQPGGRFHDSASDGYESVDGYNLGAFARDYDNPWVQTAIAEAGQRFGRAEGLAALAKAVLDRSRPGSPDEGAALCVLAYRVLAAGGADAENILRRIERYQERADGSPLAYRWKVSTLFAAAKLRLAAGDRTDAREAFERCAAMDATRFSPLLATKTVEACLLAGGMRASDGDSAGAGELFSRGIQLARAAVAGDWTNAIGRVDKPLPFGFHELAQVLDGASRCANALRALEHAGRSPGLAYELSKRHSFGSWWEWTDALRRTVAWHKSREAAQTESLAAVRENFTELHAWVEQLEQGKRWLEERVAALEGELTRSQSAVEEFRSWSRQLQEGMRWHESHAARQQTELQRAHSGVSELKAWSEQLEAAKHWLEGQVRSRDEALAGALAAAEELRRWAAQLEQSKARVEEQLRAATGERDEARALAASLKKWADELDAAKTWLAARVAALEAERAARPDAAGGAT